eukprot:GHVU01138506.1.p1 GENE.GHVU01138506.1~~GHVU01138506.1.p1  ORF type:complete len:134 (+),score=5.74 GHVU01138506.1:48-449(+)
MAPTRPLGHLSAEAQQRVPQCSAGPSCHSRDRQGRSEKGDWKAAGVREEGREDGREEGRVEERQVSRTALTKIANSARRQSLFLYERITAFYDNEEIIQDYSVHETCLVSLQHALVLSEQLAEDVGDYMMNVM